MVDYDRLHYAPKEIQLKHFPPLLALSKTFCLPLFLHSRSSEAHVDFVKILKGAGWDSTWPGGVVHSFTGTVEEAKELVCYSTLLGVDQLMKGGHGIVHRNKWVFTEDQGEH